MKKRAISLLTLMAVALVVASGVALAENVITCSAAQPCYGTDQADTMTLDDSPYNYSSMDAKGGDDTMYGKGGSDSMAGGPGKDEVRGSGGGDFLWANNSGTADVSSDYVYGGGGGDLLFGGHATAGVDHLYGGKGNDQIDANKASTGNSLTKEVIDCGPGLDSVYFDNGVDVIKNCEFKYAY